MPPDAPIAAPVAPVATPPNGAPPAGTAPPSGSPPPPAGAPPPPPSDVDKRMADLVAQEKRLTADRMKSAEERKAERAAMAKEKGELLKLLDEAEAYKKERADRKLNPKKYYERDFGENWREEVAKLAIEDGPTSGMVASEIETLKSDFKRQLDEQRTAFEKQLAERDNATKQEQRGSYLRGAQAFMRASAEKYPLVHAYQQQDNIAAVIDHHERQTATEDEAGNPVPGELLTFEEAAKRMEEHLKGVHENALKLTAPKPPPTAGTAASSRTPPSPRQTLTTQLTGTSGTPPATKAETESERRRRAIAAGEALTAKLKQERGG